MFDPTTEQKLFNEYIDPTIPIMINKLSKINDRVDKLPTTELGGLYAKIKMLMAGSQAVRAANSAAYPTAQQSTPEYATIQMKRAIMFQMKFDGLALELAGKGGTPMDPQQFEQTGLFIGLANKLSRQYMGDGSARIAQCNGAGSSTTTMAIDSPYFAKPGKKFFKVGQLIDVYTGAGAKEVDSIAITAVDDNQLTLASAQTWTDDSWIYDEDVYTASEGAGLGEMMGLEGIIRDTDPPTPNASAGLQGLLVANYPEWKATVLSNGGVKREITEDLITQLLDELDDVSQISVMLTTQGVRRAWAARLAAYKTIPNQKVLWGGWSGLPFIYDGREIPVIADKYVPDGYLYALNEKFLKIYTSSKGKEVVWEKGRDGSILQKVASYNQYVAEGHMFRNLGTGYRKGFGKITDIQEP